VDRATDWDTAWVNFANKRKAWAYVQDQLPTTHPIVADIPDLEAAKQNFDGITYAKGASVLKQLVAYVGFDAFIAGSRQYFRDHAYGNTTLADLLKALSAASGRDLAAWAAPWLQTSGISTLSMEADTHDGVLGSVAIVQKAVDPVTGREELRPHRLRVGLYNFDPFGALVRTGSVETDVTGARTPLHELTGQPRPALLLLNDDDLTYAKARLDPASEATALESLDRITDPMARALVWTALWNSARDADSPAARYVDAVQAFGPAETGIGVLLNILDNAETAVERFTPTLQRDTVRSGFLAAVDNQLDSAAPGSDHQLAWARTLASVSRHDPALLTRLKGLLDGTEQVERLAVDAELRWTFWHALAANGQATLQELDAELLRDKTASGKAGHATAAAARPDPEVKAGLA
jgi:aminopeptidase N